MGSTCTRETQRILLPRVRAGGETSGFPKISAAIRRSCPTACGMRGRGDEKPVRAQRGNTPRFSAGAHFAGRASRAAASLADQDDPTPIRSKATQATPRTRMTDMIGRGLGVRNPCFPALARGGNVCVCA